MHGRPPLLPHLLSQRKEDSGTYEASLRCRSLFHQVPLFKFYYEISQGLRDTRVQSRSPELTADGGSVRHSTGPSVSPRRVSLSGRSCCGRLLHAHTGADSLRAERAPTRTPGRCWGAAIPLPWPGWRLWFIDLFKSLRLDVSSSLRVLHIRIILILFVMVLIVFIRKLSLDLGQKWFSWSFISQECMLATHTWRRHLNCLPGKQQKVPRRILCHETPSKILWAWWPCVSLMSGDISLSGGLCCFLRPSPGFPVIPSPWNLRSHLGSVEFLFH